MSRIYKLLRKADEEKIARDLTADKEGRENMDISEIKRRILEKIEKEKAGSSEKGKTALSILSEKLGVETANSQAAGVTVSEESPDLPSRKDDIVPDSERVIKEYSEKLALIGSENETLKKLHEEALKQNEEMALQLKEKEKAVSNVDTLISRVYSTGKEAKERASRISQLEETLRAKEKKLADIDRLYKQRENIQNENDARIKSYESQIKELDDRVNQLTEEIGSKSRKIDDANTQYIELDRMLKDSALKLSVAEEEKKDAGQRLSRLTTEVSDLRRRLAEKEDAYAAIEIAKEEAELRIGPLTRENKGLEEKLSQLTDEFDALTNKLIETEKLNREIDDIAKEASFKLHAFEREKRDLEEKASSLVLELDATAKRHVSERTSAQENISKLRAELDIAKHIIKEKEKDEIDMREALSQAVSGQDLRDKKIEADMKYYEKLVKEMKELKQQVRMLSSKRDNPGI